MNTSFSLVFLLVCFLFTFSVGEAAADTDCVANAIATADPSNTVGEAISNAIAQAFSKVVSCDGGGENDENEVGPSSLAISVAVAIASSETAGAECVAETDAVAEVVSDLVTQGVAGGLLDNTDPVQQTLAEAWLAEETSNIASRLQQGADTQTGTSGSCTVAGLQKSLSTAEDVGAAMEDAISQILLAVSCGVNLEAEDPEGIIPTVQQGVDPGAQQEAKAEVEEVADCRYDSTLRKFFGPCFPAKMKRRSCNREFRDCKRSGQANRTCHKELKSCSDANLTDVIEKGARQGQRGGGRGGQGGKKQDNERKGGNKGERGQDKQKGGGGGKGGGNKRGRKF